MNAVLTTDRRFENNMSLLRAAHEGDTGAEEELLRLNTGLVRSIAQRFCGRGVDLEDLIQIGTIGLLKAIRSFDPDRGFAFSTYSVNSISGPSRTPVPTMRERMHFRSFVHIVRKTA